MEKLTVYELELPDLSSIEKLVLDDFTEEEYKKFKQLSEQKQRKILYNLFEKKILSRIK